MIVRFATLCDQCGKRSDEYTAFPSCVECMEDVCEQCATHHDNADVDHPETALCHKCRALRETL